MIYFCYNIPAGRTVSFQLVNTENLSCFDIYYNIYKIYKNISAIVNIKRPIQFLGERIFHGVLCIQNEG